MSKTDKPSLFSNIKGDLFGGITAGIVALPLALAFGVSSGMGPDAGMYGAIFIAFFAALFGGTNTQISGPTAPMTAVSIVVVASIIQDFQGDFEKAVPLILTVFLLAGLILVVLGFTGIGKYIKYIPYPVVSGFMTAIGVIILITQILPLLGYYAADDMDLINKFKPEAEEVLLERILQEEAGEGILVLENFETTIDRAKLITEAQVLDEAKALAKSNASGVIGAIKSMGRALGNINYIELLLGLLTIGIIYGFKRITKAIPSTLVALLVVSGGAYALKSAGKLDYVPIPQIPAGFPMPNLGIFTGFSLGELTPYIFSSITLAFLCAIDSLLTSVVADNMTKTRHNPNKELIGQGIGNSIAAIFGGIPGAGATIRTVVNINAGGATRLSGMIAGVLLLIILLALGPIASQIPAAVLAGILITVGIGVMDYKGLKAIPKMTKSDTAILIIVLVLSTFWNLVYAVMIGLIIAALVFMKKMGDLSNQASKITSLNNQLEPLWKDENEFPEALAEEVVIKHLKGPLFFGYTQDFTRLASQIPKTASHVIFRMDNVPYVDQSGLFALEDVLLDLHSKEVKVMMVGVKENPKLRMEAIDIIPDLISEDLLFDNFQDCLSYIKNNVKDVA